MTVKRVTSEPVPVLAGHFVVAHLPAIGGQHRHRLGGIDGTAAAQRDQTVETPGLQHRHPGIDHGAGGIGDGVGEDLPGDMGGVEPVGDPRQ